MPLDEAEALWPHTAGRRLEKVRHRVEVPGGVAEVDRYGGRAGRPVDRRGGVRHARTRREPFVPPSWFGRELTDVDGWGNGALARRGRPDAAST